MSSQSIETKILNRIKKSDRGVVLFASDFTDSDEHCVYDRIIH